MSSLAWFNEPYLKEYFEKGLESISQSYIYLFLKKTSHASNKASNISNSEAKKEKERKKDQSAVDKVLTDLFTTDNKNIGNNHSLNYEALVIQKKYTIHFHYQKSID